MSLRSASFRLSKAADAFAARRIADPPPTKNGKLLDRITPQYRLVAPHLPPWATSRYQSGALVIGEVGTSNPDAFTEHFDDDSHCICVTTGYVDLMYAVACDFASALPMLADGTKLRPQLSASDAGFRTATLLEQYRAGHLFGGHALSTYPLRLSTEQESRAIQLTDAALLFTLLHELGHVGAVVNRSLPQALEHDADVVGFTLLLGASQRLHLGWTYAGALFALRLHHCLEQAGFVFKDVTTPFQDRVAWLKGAIWTSIAQQQSQKAEIAWVDVVMEQFFQPAESFLRLVSHRPAAPAAEGAVGKPPATPRRGTSAAAQALEALQTKQPPWEIDQEGKPLDRTQWLRKLLQPLLPNVCNEWLASGAMVIGEVGRADPELSLEQYSDGSKAILVNSGLLSLLHSVSCFLHTRVRVRLPTGIEVGTVFRHEFAVAHLGLLFGELGKGHLNQAMFDSLLPGQWVPDELSLVRPSPAFLEAAQLDLAFELFEGAGAFVLLCRICEALAIFNGADAPGTTGEGYATMLYLANVPRLGFRRSYAAALVATRVCRCIKYVLPRVRAPVVLTPEQVGLVPWQSSGAVPAQAECGPSG